MKNFDSPTLSPEMEPGSPMDITDKLITKWETDMVFEDNPGETKTLGRMILDCLEAERPKRNEKGMLELIRAISDKMNTITLRNNKVEAQVKEAIRHLADAYSEYKSIEEI